MLVYLLTYNDNDNDTFTVGIFSTRELAERRILDDVFKGAKVRSPNIAPWQLDAP